MDSIEVNGTILGSSELNTKQPNISSVVRCNRQSWRFYLRRVWEYWSLILFSIINACPGGKPVDSDSQKRYALFVCLFYY